MWGLFHCQANEMPKDDVLQEKYFSQPILTEVPKYAEGL